MICSIYSICQLLLFKDVYPNDLKNAAETYLNRILEPIRKEFKSEQMQKLIADAYPVPKKPNSKL